VVAACNRLQADLRVEPDLFATNGTRTRRPITPAAELPEAGPGPAAGGPASPLAESAQPPERPQSLAETAELAHTAAVLCRGVDVPTGWESNLLKLVKACLASLNPCVTSTLPAVYPSRVRLGPVNDSGPRPLGQTRASGALCHTRTLQ
jgi:hypothetical protein